MRSLAGVRMRTERLATRLMPPTPVGCPSCRGKEATPKICCAYGDEAPEIPAESRCDVCGRLIPYRFATIVYDRNMKPEDM